MEYIHTDHCTMIFVIDMGIMQLYPIHEFSKMDVNMLMVVLVI
jgi:hypothetical protein